MKEDGQLPYFYNQSLSAEQLEDWLGQQKLHISYFNRLVKEKAELEGRLGEINKTINLLSEAGFQGKLSFPYSPNPLLENLQTEQKPKAN